jgi:hypothetical protein
MDPTRQTLTIALLTAGRLEEPEALEALDTLLGKPRSLSEQCVSYEGN